MDPLQLLLVILSSISMVLFLYIAIVLLRIYQGLRISSLLSISLSFVFLSMSQAVFISSLLLESPRESLVLSISSSSIASIGFFLLLVSIIYRNRKEMLLSIPLIMIAIPDFTASTMSFITASTCRSKQLRHYMMSLSLSYFIRGTGIILISIETGIYILIVSEALKTIATLLFATYNVSRVFKHE